MSAYNETREYGASTFAAGENSEGFVLIGSGEEKCAGDVASVLFRCFGCMFLKISDWCVCIVEVFVGLVVVAEVDVGAESYGAGVRLKLFE